MAKQHDKQFKLDAIQYYQDHKDLGVRGCAENLGIGYSTLTKWLKDFRESGDIPVRGSGCKLCLNGMPVPLLRNGYSIFNGTKYR